MNLKWFFSEKFVESAIICGVNRFDSTQIIYSKVVHCQKLLKS